jgi:hypothetical protein
MKDMRATDYSRWTALGERGEAQDDEKRKSVHISLVVVSLLLSGVQVAAQSPILQYAIAFGSGLVTSAGTRVPYTFSLPYEHDLAAVGQISRVVDPVEQHEPGPSSSEFSLNYHVLGVGNDFPGYTVSAVPPDTTLAVGLSEVVQWVNDSYADFNKSTGAIIPLNGQDSTVDNAIWHDLLPAGTLCGTYPNGDITIKFDRDAQRWVMTTNSGTSPYAVCIAVSETATFSDNLWYAWEFPIVGTMLPDAQKVGVWSSGGPSDGYYQAWNGAICAYDRAKMLVGNARAEQICFEPSAADYGILPADRDSPTPPPSAEDEFLIGNPTAGSPGNYFLPVYSVHITNWTTGDASMTGYGASQTISIAPWNSVCPAGAGEFCVPQKGVSQVLDAGGALQYRLVYWNDSTANTSSRQHWLTTFDVGSSAPPSPTALRWIEFTAPSYSVPVAQLTLKQEGTYMGVPTDSNYRFMGAIARDNAGDILLGYSESSSAIYPSIAVAGRRSSDSLGTLSPEVVVVNGLGSQEYVRWGDYSTMAVDPSDNCTFFYTTEYYRVTAWGDWSTDISSWKFPNCQ